MGSLSDIVELSHEFGTPDYVKGGGGNTSAKTANTVWVKPSGTTLAGLSPETFVAMDRGKLAELYQLDVPPDPHAREALVKDAMQAAVKDDQGLRPSVESPLHDLLEARFVVHTHPALVNGMTCARRGREACAKLFPDALWVPYVGPLTCEGLEESHARYGSRPRVFATEAGVFAAAATQRSAELALVLAREGGLVCQISTAFGGVQFLPEAEREFVENWEGGAYRKMQLG